MTPPLIFDCHLDLAWNALEYNRDYRMSLERIRRRERFQTDKGSARNTVSFPEMRRGRIGICVATQMARVIPYFGRMAGVPKSPSFLSQEQAWAATQGQLAWYREMERCGELTPIRTRAELDAQVRRWEAPDADSAKLPIGYVLSLEGADSIATLGHLERAYASGLRAVGPAHYGPGIYCHGTDDEGPFNARGHELLKEMERLGIILDVTHLCDESFWDAMRHFQGRVWASHSNCRALVNWNRQFTDEQLRELIRRDAVIGLVFDASMIVAGWGPGRCDPRDFQLKIERIVDHLDHICQLAGDCRHAGIGTDLDGGFGTEQTPMDLDSIADLARLGEILSRRGYQAADIEAVLAGNYLSFLRRAWA